MGDLLSLETIQGEDKAVGMEEDWMVGNLLEGVGNGKIFERDQ